MEFATKERKAQTVEDPARHVVRLKITIYSKSIFLASEKYYYTDYSYSSKTTLYLFYNMLLKW